MNRRSGDGEFVLTISDNEADDVPDLDAKVLEEGLSKSSASNSNNKTKTKTKTKTENKNKKRKRDAIGANIAEDEERRTKKKKKNKTIVQEKSGNDKVIADGDDQGIWGVRDEDDGVMDPEFEFELEEGGGRADADEGMTGFEGWGFEGGARKGLDGAGNKRTVDIDEIIMRRMMKMGDGKMADGDDRAAEENKEEDAELDEVDSQEQADVESAAFEMIENEQDEFMAEDGFGMGAGSDEESGDEGLPDRLIKDAAKDEQGDTSDDDSVATPVPHPDDLDNRASPAEEDEKDDLEEAARREAFFAPEESTTKTTKVNGPVTFQHMPLSRPIHRGLAAVGFSQPTPIQAKTIPVALLGKDIVGGAVTGSGKTAAFIVPIIERLLYRPKKVPTSRVAILMPTRELAIQCHAVATKLATYTDIKFSLAVGGLSLKVQEAELRLRPDVVIATPGRFIDHMRNSASFTVDTLEILVLDEADRMLEDGFADELNEILTTIPKSRQTMLFSATMNSSVDRLIRVGLNRPVRLIVDAQNQTVGTLVQEFVRLRPGREGKRMGYLLYLCSKVFTNRAIVFFRQKKEAHRARIIFGLSGLKAAELHGSMSQEQRIMSVEAFRDGKVSFLLATDLASRGLDIKGIDTVINYEAPQSHEIYLHRVGRTARAGRSGRACTLASEADRKVVKAAVKSGRAQGAKIVSRVIEAAEADTWAEKVESKQGEIEEILVEEKEDKQLAQAEMQVKRGENIIVHEDEIKSRPKRTWFESEREKRLAKKIGRAELNGVEGVAKKKEGKLSNKDKKRLDDSAARLEGKVWKKGRAERDGKGALARGNIKGEKKAKARKPMGKISAKRKFSKKRQ